MWISKKRHEELLAEAKESSHINCEIRCASLRAAHAEKEQEFRDCMEKMRIWRIRHGWSPPRGGEGHRYYSINTEFTFEMMQGIVGGAPHFARMVAEDLRERVYMALLALVHIDQEPPRYEEQHRAPLPLDFNPDADPSDTEEMP